MAVQNIQDITAQFNASAGVYTLDIGGWDYAVAHIVTPSGVITFKSSNDSGAITGVSDGSAVSAANFLDIQGVILGTGSAATSVNASAIVRFDKVGQYIQFNSSSATVTKLIVRCYKAF